MPLSKTGEQRLAIEIGTELIIQIEGMEERFKAVMIGMDLPKYIIVRLQATPDILKQLDSGTVLIVRYLFAGTAYGFRTETLDPIKVPFKLVFLSYPEEIETFNLRKAERIDCYIPASCILDGKEARGVLTDLSANGTRFTVNSSPEEPQKNVNIEDSVTLSFPLLGVEGMQSCTGKIKRMEWDTNRLSLGIQFTGVDFKIKEKIDGYIREVHDYQDGTEES